MKKFLIALNIVIWSIVCAEVAYAGGEVKEVCKDVVKKGKTVQECKKIKVHKKVEGEKVPEPAKKK